ncbi:MAG: 30S ribosomal protein S6 [Candidatus Omnitrophica bacterium]|nr:30S ribosomal protein S6 [Candidatus Omnitrophota bacterium]
MSEVNTRFYEGMLIFRPTLSEEELETAVKGVEKHLTKAGGQIVETRMWGKRKLAYPIARHKEGVYVLFYFNAPTSIISGVKRAVKLNEDVIRELITVTTENELSKTAI